MRKSIYENARVAVNQDEYNERHNSYMERQRNATERVADLEAQRRIRQNKSLILERFIQEIEPRPLVIEEFDDKLWMASISKVMVMRKGKLIFTFKDGTEIIE